MQDAAWRTVQEAARQLGVSIYTIRRWCDAGRLLGRRGLYGREIAAADLERLTRERNGKRAAS